MELSFDWDQWNIQKNEIKHGVSRLEAESLFYDPLIAIYIDKKHSTSRETRYIAYAQSYTEQIMMCAFTIRTKIIRIISVRRASKKERGWYEKEQR